MIESGEDETGSLASGNSIFPFLSYALPSFQREGGGEGKMRTQKYFKKLDNWGRLLNLHLNQKIFCSHNLTLVENFKL